MRLDGKTENRGDIEDKFLSAKAMLYAIQCHGSTNHTYDGHAYDIHLQMVADVAKKFLHIIPSHRRQGILAAAWCHDVIEDCRQTYNDVKKETNEFVADIVYALTNEKGKTRKERANDKYYDGIRRTPYASFVKVCDRIANIEYSIKSKSRMADMYFKEAKDFKNELWTPTLDPMFAYIDKIYNP